MLHCFDMKRLMFFVLASLLLAPFSGVKASASISPGDLIKGSGQAVYYYNSQGKRLVFPNEKTYFTWYADFSTVKTISDTELASISLGGNVTYRPGVFLVKITTDPKVYAVDTNGALRWVTTEAIAKELYGSDWAKKVHDIADAFFVDYAEGSPILSTMDFDPTTVMNAKQAIESDATSGETVDRGIVNTSDVSVGDLFRITIDSNASTGYAWTPTFDETSLTFVTSTYVAPTSDVIGSSGTEQFDFRAIKETAYTDIVFNYARSWETGVAPVERRTFRIIVNKENVDSSNISLSLNKEEYQPGETIFATATTNLSSPASVSIFLEEIASHTCTNVNSCSGNLILPSSGTQTSYSVSAIVESKYGTVVTTTRTITIVNEETLDGIKLAINKTSIRPNQAVEITTSPNGLISVRNITIVIDDIEKKICTNSPTFCTYSGSIIGTVGTSHSVYAKYISSTGLSYRSKTKTITIDSNDSPSVTISAGKSSLYNTETVDISVSANDDDGIQSMSILQGNTVIKTCNGPTLCTVTVGPFPSLSNGDSVTFTGKAIDLLDKEGTSSENATITIL